MLGKTGPTGLGMTGPTGPTGSPADQTNIFKGIAGENLDYLDFVYVDDSNRWYKGSAADDNKVDIMGIVVEPGGIIENCEGRISSPGVIKGFTGLSKGYSYYLSKTNPGKMTTTVPPIGEWQVFLGVAISDTEFLYEPGYVAILQAQESEWIHVGIAGEPLTYGNAVYQDTTMYGYYKKSYCTGNERQSRVDGIVISTSPVLTGEQVTIKLFGKIVNSHWLFYPGSAIYLSSSAGVLTVNKPVSGYTTYVGRALNEYTLWLNPELPVPV
jgi:hypothetical protein